MFDALAVSLTYLDAGNIYLQILCPRDESSPVAQWLEQHGEGLHHICFGVDDVTDAVETLSDPAYPRFPIGQGRGRMSGFINSGNRHGVLLECTEREVRNDGTEPD